MREKLSQLEELRLLEPDEGERADVREAVVSYTEKFLNEIGELNAYERPSEDKDEVKALLASPINDEPTPIAELIKLLETSVDKPGLNPASGGHLGYIPGGGLYYSALGDYMADVFNRYAGLSSTGPGAVMLEHMLIRWMAELVDYPPDAGGNLTTGGSLAHLIAIVTARDKKIMCSAELKRSVIYCSKQVHHSVDKAIHISGLAECKRRELPLDSRYRIIPSELEKQIKLDKKRELNPFLVIATAGTTDIGAVDPLEEIGGICQYYELWYHVDAAYGGFFVLTDEGKKKLRGIELSDSLAMDPHKGLFLPYGLGVILVKDKAALYDSFRHQTAHYMQDASESTDPSPADFSPELTKHFRGLRLWLPLKLHGVKPFRDSLEEKLLLTKYFYRKIKKLRFDVKLVPELSIVVFRYIPEPIANDLEKLNKFNKDLLEAIKDDGRIFISSTQLGGEFVLRFACLSFRTHLAWVDKLLEVVKEKTEILEKGLQTRSTC